MSGNAKLPHSAGRASWLKEFSNGQGHGTLWPSFARYACCDVLPNGALALFALSLAALAINAFDERPSPQTLTLLHPPENHYKPDENLFASLAGFDAPASQSVISVGQAKCLFHAMVNSVSMGS